MLAHIRTSLLLADLWEAAKSGRVGAVSRLEQSFAERFGFPCGLLFPYGRVALHALLTALEWRDREILCPAYTCVVVRDAIAASGNRAVYVDSAPDHFLPSVSEWRATVSPHAAMAIATPLFGYPLDKDCEQIVRDQARDAFILYDEAQSYGTADRDGFQMRDADGALFSLGLGKLLTALGGGILLLRDAELLRAVRAVRDTYDSPGVSHTFRRIAAGICAWAAYREPALSILDHLEHWLPFRDAADWDAMNGPSLPRDGRVQPSAFQARIGLRQLVRLDRLLAERRRTGTIYDEKLRHLGFRTFAHRGTPTWPRFPLPVADREGTVTALRAANIQCGLFLSTSCSDAPNATLWARTMINLPNWTGLDPTEIDRVIDTLARLRERDPAAVAWPSAPATPVN